MSAGDLVGLVVAGAVSAGDLVGLVVAGVWVGALAVLLGTTMRQGP